MVVSSSRAGFWFGGYFSEGVGKNSQCECERCTGMVDMLQAVNEKPYSNQSHVSFSPGGVLCEILYNVQIRYQFLKREAARPPGQK